MTFVILALLIAVLIAGSWYTGVQRKALKGLRDELVLVERIGEMEEKMRTRERLEAFQKEEEAVQDEFQSDKISGIAMRQGVPSVLINGTVYDEGSVFGEYIIVKITNKMITLVNQKTQAIKNIYVFEQ